MDVADGLQAIALFGFLSVVVWLEYRKAQREADHRNETYRQMLNTSGGSVEAVRELMQHEDDRRELRAIDGSRSGGLITACVGVGLTVFLYAIRPERPVYLVGLLPLCVGIALLLDASIRDRRRRMRGSAR
jgi:hypothetical protein